MKRNLVLIFLTLAVLGSNAQQDPQFTQWMFDKVSFNPAAAGIDEAHCLTMFFREQWAGFEETNQPDGGYGFDTNPQSTMFTYDGFIPVIKGGLGLTFYSDKLGQENNTVFRLAYAYHHKLKTGTLTAGIAFGFFGKKLGNNWVAIDDYTLDNAIPNEQLSANAFDLNFGLMYNVPQKYYVGLSATHLTESDLDNLSIAVARHYYFMGGADFPLGSSDFVLRSNLLAKSDFNASIFDINANVLWNNMVWGGVSFRPGDAFAPMAGFQYMWGNETQTLKTDHRIRLGYSYDSTMSDLKNYSSGSHEIFLKYCFKWTEIIIKNRHGNPRFL